MSVPQYLQEVIAVFVREEDRLFLVSPGKDVIERAWVFDPELSRHVRPVLWSSIRGTFEGRRILSGKEKSGIV
jgi:hypothetical protein